MAHIHADRVADTSITTGTGDFTVLTSPPNGFRTLNDVLASSDTFWYCIAHQSADEFEVGLGTYSGSNVFARTAVYQSSNSNAAVDFSAGTKDVFITTPAAEISKISGKLTAADNLSDVASAATARTSLGLGTGDSPQLAGINVGHASDTPVTRVKAGVLAAAGEPLNGEEALTDGATPALDASKGNTFRLVTTTDPEIAAPSNPSPSQKIVIAITASGAARTPTLNTGTGGFRYGADITALTAIASGKTDYVGAIYNAADDKWDVVAYAKGY